MMISLTAEVKLIHKKHTTTVAF